MKNHSEIKFIADHMLGKLTRWLRILGYDTVYPPPETDREMIEAAESSNRILLTRDKTVAETKKAKAVYIKSDMMEEQLAQLVTELSLNIDSELKENKDGSLVNRCALCNGVLKSISKEEAHKSVPEGVKEHFSKFWKCSGCEKIYWEGTHWDQIKEKVNKITKS
jgi:uncharacterized protein with PIN domain